MCMSQSACSAGESSHLLHVLENDLVLAGFSKVACRRLVEHAIVGGRVGQTPLIEHALDRRRYHRGGLAHDELEIVVGDEDDGVCICHFFGVSRWVGVRVRRARLLRSRAANLGLGLGLGLDRLSIAKRELIGMANILPLLGCQLHVNSTPTTNNTPRILRLRNSYATLHTRFAKGIRCPLMGHQAKRPRRIQKEKERQKKT